MRVLLLPTVFGTSRDLSGLSEWSHHMDIVRSMARKGAPVFWYIAVPEKSQDVTYGDSMFDYPNVKVLPYRFSGRRMSFPDEWANWLSVYSNEVPFDVVWNNGWWNGTAVSVTIHSTVEKTFPGLINGFYDSPRAPELKAHQGNPHVDFQMLSGALNDHSVLMTEYHRTLFMDIARMYMGGSYLKDLPERVEVIPPAVDATLLDGYRERFDEERKNRDELVVFLAGGLSEAKRRFEDIARVVKRIREAGYPIRLKIRTQSSSSKPRAKRLEQLGAEIEYECPRSRFLSGLGDADVVVDATKDEGTGLAGVESIMSGAVYLPVVQRWMEGRIPHDYGLAIHSWSDLEAMLVAMSKDKAGFLERHAHDIHLLEQHTRAMFSSDAVADRVVDLLKRVEDRKRPFRVSRSFLELVENAVSGVERLTLSELYSRMRRYAKSDKVDWSVGNKQWNSLIARRALEIHGYTDICDGPEPVFVKGGGS